MGIPAWLLPLTSRFRPQREDESTDRYLRAALKAAEDLPLESTERMLEEIRDAQDEDENNPG